MNVNRNGVVRGIAALAAATTGAASAQAADVAAEGYAPPIMDDQSDWTGIYAGASLAYGDGDIDYWDDNYDIDGGLAGAFMGFNHDFGQTVVGVEAAFHGAAVSGLSDGDEDYRVQSVIDVHVRAGYDGGDWLLYALAGGSVSTWKASDNESYTEFGINVGAGVEAMVTENISVGLELVHRFGTGSYDQVGYNGSNVDLTTVSLRSAWHF